MRYVSKCIRKQMRLQPLPENVGTERQVSEVVKQCVPGHRTGDGERPTVERAATISWYDGMSFRRRSTDNLHGGGTILEQNMHLWCDQMMRQRSLHKSDKDAFTKTEIFAQMSGNVTPGTLVSESKGSDAPSHLKVTVGVEKVKTSEN